MLQEVPHHGVLQLVDFGAAQPQYLWHRNSGEVHQLQNRCELDFTEAGFGYLSPSAGDDSEPVWVNNILGRSLHQAGGACGGGTDGIMIFSKAAGSYTPFAAPLGEMTSHIFTHTHRAGQQVQ